MSTFDLQEIRKQLDKIDREIVTLFEERMRLCGDGRNIRLKTADRSRRDREREAGVCEGHDGRQLPEAGRGRTVQPDDDDQPSVSV